jgi:hypothetical protein
LVFSFKDPSLVNETSPFQPSLCWLSQPVSHRVI